MSKIEFLFDFGSPNAYLCHRVIPDIEARVGERFEYVPILLGGVFKATGNVSPVVAFAGIENKLRYGRLEMERFVAAHGLTDFRLNPHFPVNTLALMRGAIAAQRLGVFERYVDVMFRCMWVDGLKMDDPDTVAKAIADNGFDTDALLAAMQDPDVKSALAANTAAAVERGCFGSPTFFVDGEIWFGKEHLRDVEEAIIQAQENARAI